MLARNLEDLTKRIVEPKAKAASATSNMNILFRQVDLALRQAETYALEEDAGLEKSYLYFMIAATVVIDLMPKHPQYRNAAHAEGVSRAKKRVIESLAKIEELKPRLVAKYAQAAEEEAAASKKRKAEEMTSVQQQQQQKQQGVQPLPPPPQLPQTSPAFAPHAHPQAQPPMSMSSLSMGMMGAAQPQRQPAPQFVSPPQPPGGPFFGATAPPMPMYSPAPASVFGTPQPQPQPQPPFPQVHPQYAPQQFPLGPAASQLPPPQPPSNFPSAPPAPPSAPLYSGIDLDCNFDRPNPSSQQPRQQKPPASPLRTSQGQPLPAHVQEALRGFCETPNTDPTLRKVFVDGEMFGEFMALAQQNTARGIETCALLSGFLKNDVLTVTHCVVPKQTAATDTCAMLNEDEIFTFHDKRSLITIGWIHTHPTQSLFMSSVDLHTHFPYQALLPEAIAVVVAPKFDPNFGIFGLLPDGLGCLTACDKKGFHEHPERNLYANPSHVTIRWGHPSYHFCDLRK